MDDIFNPSTREIDHSVFAKHILFFSGGKDSVYSYFALREAGVPAENIELHHHLIDGNEGSELMDWPITESYCRAFAAAVGSPLYFSWRIGGFEQEMLRDGSPTSAIAYEDEDHRLVIAPGRKRPPLGTRRRFPQVSSNLSQRWCSSSLKIDVADRLIRRQFRFADERNYLVITGERAEESAARAKYEDFEKHRTYIDGRVHRYIYHSRLAKHAIEAEVWDMLKRHRINPHPAYHAGWGRTSCLTCIFGSHDQWATVQRHAPERFEEIRRYEEEFGVSIHRKMTIVEQAMMGRPYDVPPDVFQMAMGTDYTDNIIVEEWKMPLGAFGDASGPS